MLVFVIGGIILVIVVVLFFYYLVSVGVMVVILFVLLVFGVLVVYVGGVNFWKGVLWVIFWGVVVMVLSVLVGSLFGIKV